MSKHDLEVIHSVPDPMQRLVRYTVKGFYGIEHGLAIDVLIKNPCIKEEDLQELLKFDRKQLRAILNQLKTDKFLKSRLHVETTENGKLSRHNYFFINYRSIANIIKYKLHKMHKLIETKERDACNRPSFKCPTCENTYGDLDVSQLLNPMLGTLNCIFCKSEVIEDKETASSQDIRTSQARFSDQTEVLYKLLKQVEDINLSEDILEPKPNVININNLSGKSSRSTNRSKEPQWTSDKNSNELGCKRVVTINIGEDKGGTSEKDKSKEIPEWLRVSTVAEQSSTENFDSVNSGNKRIKLDVDTLDKNSDPKSVNDESEVLRWLLIKERPAKQAVPSTAPPASEESSDEEDFDDVDDENEIMVMVGGKAYTYEEVANRGQELIQLMSEQEKSEYIQKGQEYYRSLHD